MATHPDVTPYVDLTLLDEDAVSLVGQALADAPLKFPGWTPREGHQEVTLLEAQALVISELIYAVNRLPGALLEAVLGVYGLTRDPGSPPVAPVTFTTASLSPVTVPRGTRLRLLYAGDTASIDLATDVELVIPGGAGTGTVTATASLNTDVVNGHPAGARLELLDTLTGVELVALAGDVTGGAATEDAEAYRERGVNVFARLTSTLVLPEQFTAAALALPGITRARTVDLYNPNGGTPGADLGHVTIAAGGTGGVPLLETDRAAVEATLAAQAAAMLTIHVTAPTVTDVDVAVTVARRPDAVTADVTAAVTAALTGHLDPDAWEWGATVYRNTLLGLSDRATGVARVVDVTTPTGDVTLPGVAPLARAGTITVTVVEA